MPGFNNLNQIDSADYFGYFVGTVKANNDPQQRQRVKVSIPKLFEGSVDDLPWVAPLVSSPFGMTSNSGVMQVPALGSLVVVEFQKGDVYNGLYSHSIHSLSHTPDPALLLNYPNRRGWRDPQGNLWWVDTTTGSVEIHLKHKSGTYVHINNAGDVEVNSVTKVTVNAPTAEVNADDVLVTASSMVDITSPETKVNGKLTLVGDLDASGGTFKHNSVNVGSTHVHPAGFPNTGVPVP